MVALLLVPMLSVAAIAIDGGLLMSDRRQAQRAADAAALAAAVDLFTNYTTNQGVDTGGNAAKSAKTTAVANGFTTSEVTVNIPPKSGVLKGVAGAAEVIITHDEPRYFSNVMGSGALKVTARAVARGLYSPAAPGILILDPTDNNTLKATASGNVTVTNGGAIDVDSKSANGGATCTNTGNIVADTINLSDNTYNHSNTGTLVGTVNYNVPPTPDPLANLTEPAQPSLPPTPPTTPGLNYSTNNGVNYSGSTTLDLYPGYYAGLSSSGTGNIVLHDNTDGSPGIYWIGSQGLSITSSGGLSGTNVMIYSNGGANTSITGSGSVNLTPPTSGTYKGISFFQERTASKDINITASGNMSMTGTFYAAKGNVSITCSGGYNNTIGAQWIAWQLAVTGTGSFTVDYSGTATPVRVIQLVE
jgi:hypothetical protein